MIQDFKKAKTPLDLIVFVHHNYKKIPWEAYSLVDEKVTFEIKQPDYEFLLEIYEDESLCSAALDLTDNEDWANGRKRIVFFYKIREKDKKEWLQDSGEVSVFASEQSDYAKAKRVFGTVRKHAYAMTAKRIKSSESQVIAVLLDRLTGFAR